LKSAPFTYHRAQSLAHAIELSGKWDGTAKLMAGGQSLMPMMALRMSLAEHVIDISGISSLREAKVVGERLLIGSGVTHAMIEDGRVEDPARGYLRHVASGIAYRSIRNRGTIGGSLAHADPAADWPAALLALNSIAVIQNAQGERQLPLADFQRGLMETALGSGELLKGVLVPRLSAKARWAYRKFCRKQGEFAQSIAAVVIDPALGLSNIVLGAVGGKPLRLSEKGYEDELAAAGIDPSSYEFQLHRTILRRAIAEARKGSEQFT
jgi:carbon-monoxide dehydrogenase medium subunit